jgi:hypothetical protein
MAILNKTFKKNKISKEEQELMQKQLELNTDNYANELSKEIDTESNLFKILMKFHHYNIDPKKFSEEKKKHLPDSNFIFKENIYCPPLHQKDTGETFEYINNIKLSQMFNTSLLFDRRFSHESFISAMNNYVEICLKFPNIIDNIEYINQKILTNSEKDVIFHLNEFFSSPN